MSGSSSELQSIVRFDFRGGDVEEFKLLSRECLEIVRSKDPGTLQYDTFFDADETACIVLERFRDEQSLIEHSENIGEERMAAIVATGSCSGELLGAMSEDLRARLAGSPVGLFFPYQRL